MDAHQIKYYRFTLTVLLLCKSRTELQTWQCLSLPCIFLIQVLPEPWECNDFPRCPQTKDQHYHHIPVLKVFTSLPFNLLVFYGFIWYLHVCPDPQYSENTSHKVPFDLVLSLRPGNAGGSSRSTTQNPLCSLMQNVLLEWCHLETEKQWLTAVALKSCCIEWKP